MRDLCRYWQHGFDWRAVEAALNRHPQFIADIDGQPIHLLHVRSKHPEARPLLLIHGWPGTVLEYVHLIDALTDPVAHGGRPEDAFHVVLPSVPGFGFAGPTRDKGWSPERVARAFVQLMVELGYERFGVHGNDFGSIAAREIALFAPERLVGAHVTQFFAFLRRPRGVRRAHPRRSRAARRAGAVRRARRLQPDHGQAPASPGLRPERLARGPVGVEPRPPAHLR
ncbi:epoxide hydrolase [Nannocystis pusilla]|uniref:epoxide hydrolase family protein n=1 Tax=Nannocystis pusilla TaxID=889268 RepID=UPI003B7A64E4